MFEFITLSPEEILEITKIRSLNEYPEHSPKDFFQRDFCVFITSKTINANPILNSVKRLTEFEASLHRKFKDYGAELTGWIIFPDHFHILMEIDNSDKIPYIMNEVHKITSYSWNAEDSSIGRKIWDQYLQHLVDSPDNYYALLNYIHNNAIKHHYSCQPADWIWSSLHLYQKDHGSHWLIDKMLQYPFHERA